MSHDQAPEAEAQQIEPAETGVAEVDAVLRDLDGLEHRPVDEHVEVFENAHERLRRALDADPAVEDA